MRIRAFLSMAVFPIAPAVSLKVGMPVVRFLEPSSGNATSAPLMGWDVSHLSERKMMSRNAAPPSPWDLNMGAILCLPKLSGHRLPYGRIPDPNYSSGAHPCCFPQLRFPGA